MASGFSSSLSGISSAFFRQSVTADNVSNLNTTGFKESRVEQASSDAGGTQVEAVTRDTSQGSLIRTGRRRDVAIEGDGFFEVEKNGESLFTRSGSFDVDAEGNLVNTTTGGVVQGFQPGRTGGDTESIRLSAQQRRSSPQPTDTLSFEGNLSTDLENGDTTKVAVDLVDSRGQQRSLTVEFERLNGDEFAFSAPDPETGKTALDGKLTFDGRGEVESVDVASSPNSPGGFNGLFLSGQGSDPVTVSAGDLGFSTVTLQGGGTDLAVGDVNGREAGDLSSLSVTEDGTVQGQFSNGDTQTLGRVALTRFSNAAGLENRGNGLLAPSANSGEPQSGAPGRGGRGRLRQGFLEASNVDLSDEIIDSIANRNATEANVGALRVRDEMMGSLLDLTG